MDNLSTVNNLAGHSVSFIERSHCIYTSLFTEHITDIYIYIIFNVQSLSIGFHLQYMYVYRILQEFGNSVSLISVMMICTN